MSVIAAANVKGTEYVFAAETGLMGGVVYTVTARFADGEDMLCVSHRSKGRVARWFAAASA